MNDHMFDRRELFKKAAVTGVGMGALASGSALAQAAPDAESAPVPRKKLGSTGEDIPILLLGGGEGYDMTYDKVLHRALKDGVNYIDTALSYANGKSHESVGVFVEQVADRKKLWITSKVWKTTNTVQPEAYSAPLPKILASLKTDYLDMFFMHGIQNPRVLDPEFLKMADDLKKSGTIRYFGFSCHDGTVVELLNKAASIGSDAINAIMFRYSFAQYGNTELNKAMDACKKAGIGLIAMKTQDSVPADQENVVGFESKNFTLPQAKLKAVWADERIDAAVSHINTTDKLRDNVAAAKSPVQLSMNEFMQLNRLAALTSSYRCKGCSQICESRIDGDLKVADTLRYLMYHESYGRHGEAREKFARLTPTQRDFSGIDLSAATAACPQGIDIAARLRKAHEALA